MEVMSGAEFKQTQVVVGQQTVTTGFSVSDDPMLMSILSTGLYQRPLKSMIQEAMFNAWDAHKASGRTDTPVEVIVTEDNQLIISDSGFGIAPEDMNEIYCVYGASTKRDDNDQTGGFGLGCKAPFAYTDSFRVTSSHNGKRTLYLVSRANDDNDGKPGITALVSNIECDSSGLTVSIPLKNGQDAQKTYTTLKTEIFPYSGINWTLKYKDSPLETGQESSLAPGDYVLEPGHIDEHEGLIAQYGGVAYNVPYAEEYKTEYDYLMQCIGNLGSIRAGFSSGTLTPLPSREGLNLSDTTVKNLKDQLGVVCENLSKIVKPMLDLAVNWTAHCLGYRGADDSYPLYDNYGDPYYSTVFHDYLKVGVATNFSDCLSVEENHQYLNEPMPEGSNVPLVNRLRYLIMHKTTSLVLGIGKEWFVRRKAIAWSIQNGHCRKRFEVIERFEGTARSKCNQYSDHFSKARIDSMIANVVRLCAEIKVKPHIRVHGEGYNTKRISYLATEKAPRGYNAEQTYKRLVKEKKHKPTTRIKLHSLRYTNSNYNSELKNISDTDVILGHTIKDVDNFPYDQRNFHRRDVPIIIVGTSKEKMKAATEFFSNKGFNVVVAPKYVEPVASCDSFEEPKAKKPEGWPTMCTYSDGYVDEHNLEEDPDFYFEYSKTQEKREKYYWNNRLSNNLIRCVDRFFSDKKIVVVNHPNKVRSVKKTGAISVRDHIDHLVAKLTMDPDFNAKFEMYRYVVEYRQLPEAIATSPEFSKVLGLPYLRTSQLLKFKRLMSILETFVKESESEIFCSKETRDRFVKLQKSAQEVSERTKKVLRCLEILDPDQLRMKINPMSAGERKVYCEKLARFIRTTAT